MGPTSLGSPQLQQSRRHSLAAIPDANGQFVCGSPMLMGQAAEAASARNGQVSASAVGSPARSATTNTAANWIIRFIRLL